MFLMDSFERLVAVAGLIDGVAKHFKALNVGPAQIVGIVNDEDAHVPANGWDHAGLLS